MQVGPGCICTKDCMMDHTTKQITGLKLIHTMIIDPPHPYDHSIQRWCWCVSTRITHNKIGGRKYHDADDGGGGHDVTRKFPFNITPSYSENGDEDEDPVYRAFLQDLKRELHAGKTQLWKGNQTTIHQPELV
jgi:hypothetical protein